MGQVFASQTLQWCSLDVAFIDDSEMGHTLHIWPCQSSQTVSSNVVSP